MKIWPFRGSLEARFVVRSRAAEVIYRDPARFARGLFQKLRLFQRFCRVYLACWSRGTIGD